ncbi:MAG: hypothetical protein RIQ71_1679 [Verrucomicrobiota bacterium]|jgi:hypothetical protein
MPNKVLLETATRSAAWALIFAAIAVFWSVVGLSLFAWLG